MVRPDEDVDTLGGVVRYLKRQRGTGTLASLFGKSERADGLQCWVFFGIEAKQEQNQSQDAKFPQRKPSKSKSAEDSWLPSNETTAAELLRMARDRQLTGLVVLILNEFPMHMRSLRTTKDALVVSVPASTPDLRAAAIERRMKERGSASVRTVTLAGNNEHGIHALFCCMGITEADASVLVRTARVPCMPYPCWQIPVATSPTVGRTTWCTLTIRCTGVPGNPRPCPFGCGFSGGEGHALLCAALRHAPITFRRWRPDLGKLEFVVAEQESGDSLAGCINQVYSTIMQIRNDFRDKVIQDYHDRIEDKADGALEALQQARLACNRDVLDTCDVVQVLQHLQVLQQSPQSQRPVPLSMFATVDLALAPASIIIAEEVCVFESPRPSGERTLPVSPVRAGLICVEKCVHALTHSLTALPDAVFWLLRTASAAKDPTHALLPSPAMREAMEFVLVEHVLSLFPSVGAQGFWAQFPKVIGAGTVADDKVRVLFVCYCLKNCMCI